MVEIESLSNSNNWLYQNQQPNQQLQPNHHHNNNNHQHQHHNQQQQQGNNNGQFLQPLPLNNSSTGLNKSIEWLYEHSLGASTKGTKSSNGFSLLQDGTQSPSSFLNLSSTGGNNDEPVQVPMGNQSTSTSPDNSNSFQYTISPLLSSTPPHGHHHQNHSLLQSITYQQSSPISLVPQSSHTSNSNNNNIHQANNTNTNNNSSGNNNYYSSSSSAGSSPIQDYYSPSSSPLTITDSSPIPSFPNNLNTTKQPQQYTQFNALKQTTGIPNTMISSGGNTDTFSYYNYVEPTLLNQINLSSQHPVIVQSSHQQIQNNFVPTISSSTPSSPTTVTTTATTTNINNNNLISNSNIINNSSNILLAGISSHNIIHNMSEEEIEKPFNIKKFQDDLKSIVPTYNETPNELSESSGQSESSQESDYDLNDQRHVSIKKRGRDQEEIDVSGLTVLPREKVLKLTSKEIEDYVARLKQNHVLTQAEEKDLKKQRRLVKNREYASQSRSRRKVYVESIESKLQKTNQDCTSIKNQLNQVKEENKLLKKQLYSIVSTLKSDSSLAQAFGKLLQPLGNNKPSSTTTLFIFIFLFSFTFLFKSPISFNSPSSTVTFNSDSASSLQRNLLEFDETTNNLPSSEWKKAILEETKRYVDGLVDSIYSNINFKQVSETKLDKNTFLPVNDNENNSTDNEKQQQQQQQQFAQDEITSVLSGLSVNDKDDCENVNQESLKDILRSDSPPLVNSN